MIQERKYHVSRSGSGWGIWDAVGNKVKSCGTRYNAVKTLYEMMGWTFNPSKFR